MNHGTILLKGGVPWEYGPQSLMTATLSSLLASSSRTALMNCCKTASNPGQAVLPSYMSPGTECYGIAYRSPNMHRRDGCRKKAAFPDDLVDRLRDSSLHIGCRRGLVPSHNIVGSKENCLQKK